MTLIEQREAMLGNAEIRLDRLPAEVGQWPIGLTSGAVLAYRKAILCAE